MKLVNTDVATAIQGLVEIAGRLAERCALVHITKKGAQR